MLTKIGRFKGHLKKEGTEWKKSKNHPVPGGIPEGNKKGKPSGRIAGGYQAGNTF